MLKHISVATSRAGTGEWLVCDYDCFLIVSCDFVRRTGMSEIRITSGGWLFHFLVAL